MKAARKKYQRSCGKYGEVCCSQSFSLMSITGDLIQLGKCIRLVQFWELSKHHSCPFLREVFVQLNRSGSSVPLGLIDGLFIMQINKDDFFRCQTSFFNKKLQVLTYRQVFLRVIQESMKEIGISLQNILQFKNLKKSSTTCLQIMKRERH